MSELVAECGRWDQNERAQTGPEGKGELAVLIFRDFCLDLSP